MWLLFIISVLTIDFGLVIICLSITLMPDWIKLFGISLMLLYLGYNFMSIPIKFLTKK